MTLNQGEDTLSVEFKRLEQINADLDVLIDEEEHRKIEEILILNPKIKKPCCGSFYHIHCSVTKRAKKAWKTALMPVKNDGVPIVSVNGLDLQSENEIHKYWSHLMYAKLLRAKVMWRGTDCYFNRLNDVVAYLERNLPPLSDDSDNTQQLTKLHVLYLIELSECGLAEESLGFAERARRVLLNSPALDTQFKDFYDLYARYNLGVAHFHMGRHRAAVLEFNYIIYKLKKLTGNNSKGNTYFGGRTDNNLLYYPAITYRADIQLKLQLAYHALDTAYEHIESRSEDVSEYRKVKLELIKIQAYQIIDRLDLSARGLKAIFKALFKEEFGGDLCPKGDIPPAPIIPDVKRTRGKQNVESRFVGLLIDQHLNFLNDLAESKTKEEAREWSRSYDQYLNELKKAIVDNAYSWFKFQHPNRKGFAEQWAEYLGWLAENNQEQKARELYNNKRMGNKFLKSTPREAAESEGNSPNIIDCALCRDETLDLQRLPPEHYNDFRDNVWKFFETCGGSKKTYQKHRRSFFLRLMQLEMKRDDLRINDLELRYKINRSPSCPMVKNGSRRLPCWDNNHIDARGFYGVLRCHECKKYRNGHNSDGEDRQSASVNYDENHSAADYEKIMSDWEKSFYEQLEEPSYHAECEDGVYFLGLRRWNSSSPAKGFSLGGGYFIYQIRSKQVTLGIAIDPGFDFMRNLFHAGFSLRDIDIVLISHAHVDHLRDYESIVNLLFELKKQTNKKKRIHTLMTLGIYRRLEYIIESPTFRDFIEPYVIDIEKEVNDDFFEKSSTKFDFEVLSDQKQLRSRQQRVRPKLPGDTGPGTSLIIRPTRAYHQDYSDYSDSFGYLVEFNPSDSKKIVIGYTGDTKWVESMLDDPLKTIKKKDSKPFRDRKIEIIDQYKDTDALIVHIGSLIDKEKNKGEKDEEKRYSFDFYAPGDENKCEKLIRNKNHPYLIGLLRLLSNFSSTNNGVTRNRLILLSEFGEELRGGIRVDLVKRLQKTFGQADLTFVPVDVGINIHLRNKSSQSGLAQIETNDFRILCTQCNRFVNISKKVDTNNKIPATINEPASAGKGKIQLSVDFQTYGVDEGLYCICDTCRKALSNDVVQDRLRRLSEVGYEFHSR